MSKIIAFASALREASDAAFELLEIQTRQHSGFSDDDQLKQWVRNRADTLVACFGASHRVRKLAPLVAGEIEPPNGVGTDAWLAGILTHVDLVKDGATFLDFPDPQLLPADFRGVAEYVEGKKDQWTLAASELGDAARHLENLAWVRGQVGLSKMKCVRVAKAPRRDDSHAGEKRLDSVLPAQSGKLNARQQTTTLEPAKRSVQGERTDALSIDIKQEAVDESAFRPAKELRSLKDGMFPTHKKFLGWLKRHPNVKRKHNGQKLLIHAGDFHAAIAGDDRKAFEVLDAPAEVVDGFVRETQRRQDKLRQQKAAQKRLGE